MLPKIDSNLHGMAHARWQRLQQAAYRQAMLRVGQAPLKQGGRSAVDVIAEQNRDAVLATLQGEEAVDERSLLIAGTADGALGEIAGLLSEARGLFVTDSLSPNEHAARQIELDSILAGIDRIAQSATFGTMRIFDGSNVLQAGRHQLKLAQASTGRLGAMESNGRAYSLADLKSGGSLSLTSDDPTTSSRVIDAAISQVSQARQEIGNFAAHYLAPRLKAVEGAREQLAQSSSALGDFDSAMTVLKGIRQDLLQRAGQFASNARPSIRGTLLDRVG